jgi:hypothetical protein
MPARVLCPKPSSGLQCELVGLSSKRGDARKGAVTGTRLSQSLDSPVSPKKANAREGVARARPPLRAHARRCARTPAAARARPPLRAHARRCARRRVADAAAGWARDEAIGNERASRRLVVNWQTWRNVRECGDLRQLLRAAQAEARG